MDYPCCSADARLAIIATRNPAVRQFTPFRSKCDYQAPRKSGNPVLATIGALSAVVAEFFSRGVTRPQPSGAHAQAIMNGVSAGLWALNQVTGKRWLAVTGRRDPQGRPGFATTVKHYDAATLDEARELMVADISRAKRARGVVEEIVGGLRDLQRRNGDG